MVNGRIEDVWHWRARAGVLVLVLACGGKSVSRPGDDGNGAGDGGRSSGGTGGGGTSHGPTAEPPSSAGTASASGGASSASGGASSGGASPGIGAGSGGVGAGPSGPNLSMLDDLCENICNSGAEARCEGIELDECLSSCFGFAKAAYQTAACKNAAYGYLACVNALPNVCDLIDETLCSSRDVVACVVEYCSKNPGAAECTSIGGSPE